jgi:hypothetical protein
MPRRELTVVHGLSSSSRIDHLPAIQIDIRHQQDWTGMSGCAIAPANSRAANALRNSPT